MSTQSALPDGEFCGQTPALALKTVCARDATGMLSIHRGRVTLTALIQSGRPVFATSTDREDRLSTILIREHLVSLLTLEKGIERMLKGGRRLGEVLVEDAALSGSALQAALHRQTREILCRMLAPGHDRVRFQEEAALVFEDIGFRMPVNTLIWEACRRTDAFYHILDAIGGLASTYVQAPGFQEEVRTCGLTDAEMICLSIFARPVSLRQASERSQLRDFDLCRLIWMLLTVGALTRLE